MSKHTDTRSLRLTTLVRSKLAGKAAVAQMADDFRVLNTRRGSVDREDLELCGWRNPQIDEYAPRARQRAMTLEVRA